MPGKTEGSSEKCKQRGFWGEDDKDRQWVNKLGKIKRQREVCAPGQGCCGWDPLWTSGCRGWRAGSTRTLISVWVPFWFLTFIVLLKRPNYRTEKPERTFFRLKYFFSQPCFGCQENTNFKEKAYSRPAHLMRKEISFLLEIAIQV